MNGIYTKIEKSFENMEKLNKVDLSVIEDLKKIIKEINLFSNELLEKKDDIVSNFSIYFSIDAKKKILNKMIQRLKDAKRKKDNPQIATDSLAIITPLSDMYMNLKMLKKGKKPIITDFLGESSELQIKAMNYNLYPSKEDTLKKIKKEKLGDNGKEFVNKVGGILESK